MQETKYIVIKDKEIPVIIRSYKTSKYLKMYFKANILHISKPKYVSMKKALEFVKENENDVYQKYIQLSTKPDTRIKQWVTGETISLKGEAYTINAIENEKQRIQIQAYPEEKTIKITYPKNLNQEAKKQNIDRGIKKFLQYQTQIFLEKEVPYWSQLTNIAYKQFKVNDATSKFGSCIPKTKVLHFSSRLIMLPERVIDAIVVHELCHIVHPNHSKNFYELVRSFIPEYDEINKWLKKNGKMILF